MEEEGGGGKYDVSTGQTSPYLARTFHNSMLFAINFL